MAGDVGSHGRFHTGPPDVVLTLISHANLFRAWLEPAWLEPTWLRVMLGLMIVLSVDWRLIRGLRVGRLHQAVCLCSLGPPWPMSLPALALVAWGPMPGVRPLAKRASWSLPPLVSTPLQALVRALAAVLATLPHTPQAKYPVSGW